MARIATTTPFPLTSTTYGYGHFGHAEANEIEPDHFGELVGASGAGVLVVTATEWLLRRALTFIGDKVESRIKAGLAAREQASQDDTLSQEERDAAKGRKFGLFLRLSARLSETLGREMPLVSKEREQRVCDECQTVFGTPDLFSTVDVGTQVNGDQPPERRRSRRTRGARGTPRGRGALGGQGGQGGDGWHQVDLRGVVSSTEDLRSVTSQMYTDIGEEQLRVNLVGGRGGLIPPFNLGTPGYSSTHLQDQ